MNVPFAKRIRLAQYKLTRLRAAASVGRIDGLAMRRAWLTVATLIGTVKRARQMIFRGCRRAMASALLVILAGTAQAQSGTYINPDTGGLWSDPANWSGGIIADGVGSTADFSTLDIISGNTVLLDTPRTISNLTFRDTVTGTSAGWTISNNGNPANVLTIANNGTISVSPFGTGSSATINAILGGQTINVLAQTAGGGVLNINQSNTFTELFNVGITAGANEKWRPTVNLNALGGNAVSGTMLQIGGGNYTQGGLVNLFAANQINDLASVNLRGNFLSGRATLNLNGFTETIRGLSGNSSGTSAPAGTEVVNNSNTNTILTINTAGNSYDYGTGDRSDQVMIRDRSGGTTTGTLGITKQGEGTQIIGASQGARNSITYTGPTTVEGGTLVLRNTDGFASDITVGSAGTLVFRTSVASDVVTISTAITGAGGIVKDGVGTTQLSGDNSYSGPTTINAGTLRLLQQGYVPAGATVHVDASALPEGSIATWQNTGSLGATANLTGGGTVQSGGTKFNNNVVAFNGAQDLRTSGFDYSAPGSASTVAYVGALDGTQNGRLLSSNNNWLLGFWSGNKDRAHFGTNWVAQGGATDTVGHTYMGTVGADNAAAAYGDFRLLGSAADRRGPQGLVVGGWANNTERSQGSVGEILVYDTVLSTADRLALEAHLYRKWYASATSGLLPSTTDVSLTATGTVLDINGNTQTIASLTGVAGSSVLLGTGSLTLDKAAGTSSFAGEISGTGTLTKTGESTQTLAGTNPFAGTTTVQQGTLLLTGNLANSNVHVTGGNFALSNGAINNASVASLTQSGGRVRLDHLFNVNDQLTVTGTYTHTGGSIFLDLSTTPQAGTYTLVNYGSLIGTPSVELPASRLSSTVNHGSGTADAISFTLSGSVGNLTWTGANGTAWDLDTTQNWDLGGNPDVFLSLDNVTFGDSAANTTPVISGNLTVGSMTFEHTSGTYTLSGGSLVGNSTMDITSGGSVLLQNLNAFNGPISIAFGSSLEVAGSIGSGAYSGTIDNNEQLIISSSQNQTLSGAITGFGGLTKNGNGTLTLSGANGYDGETLINAGTLVVANGAALGSQVGATRVAGGTLNMNGQNLGSETILLAGGKIVNNGAQQTQAINNLQVTADSEIGGTGRWDVRGSTALTTIDPNVTLTKTDSNLIYLSVDGVLSNDGTIQINQGSVGIWNTTIVGGGSFTVNAGGTLRIERNTVNPQNVTLNGGQLFIGDQSGVSNQQGTVHLNNVAANQISPNGNYMIVDGQITGPGGFILSNGGGTPGLSLSNPSNNFQGNVTINTSTFLRTVNSEVLPDTASITNNGAFRLDVPGGGTETIAGLSGAGSVWIPTTNNGTHFLRIGEGDTSSTFAGSLGASGQNNALLSVAKIGAGTFTHTGTGFHTAGTTVEEGTLILTGTHAAGGLITVNPGATLGGTGILGDVNVVGNGALSPGLSAGKLTVRDLTLDSSSTLNFELGAPNLGDNPLGSDIIEVTRNLTLGGNLFVSALPGFGTPAIGDSWVLINYAGTLNSSGLSVSSAPLGVQLAVDEISSPGQILLTVVIPEPNVATLLLLGAAMLLHLRRQMR